VDSAACAFAHIIETAFKEHAPRQTRNEVQTMGQHSADLKFHCYCDYAVFARYTGFSSGLWS
jgi:hypothetical protein